MKNVPSYKSAIFALLGLTLMTGTMINGSVLAQPTTTTNATEPLTLSIYSKATGIEYVYNNVKNEQEFVDALNEVDAITHPELAAAGQAGAADVGADEADKQLAADIFSLASLNTTETEEAGTEAVPAIVASAPALIKAGKFLFENKDTIVKVASGVGSVAKKTLE